MAEEFGIRDARPKEPAQKTADQLCWEGCAAEEAEDDPRALPLFEQAAELGHAKSQLLVGPMDDNGEGTAVNKEKARYWLGKYAQSIDQSEQAILQELEEMNLREDSEAVVQNSRLQNRRADSPRSVRVPVLS